MTPALTYQNLPVFGTGASLVQPVAGTYNGGFLPGQLFPAEYENWLMNYITANSSFSQTGVTSVVAEMLTILTHAGISANNGDNTQVYQSLNLLYAGIATVTPISLTNGASPYSLVSGSTPVLEISATTNPFIVNLPAATGSGYRVKICNTSALSTGLVKIVPATGEKIGVLAANTACYLQNVDQSGWAFAKQILELVDVATGQWTVAGGQFMPEPGSVDSAGTQYFFGKLRKLPTGNTTVRNLASFNISAAAFSVAKQVTGSFGVPSGAKGIRASVLAFGSTGGAGTYLGTVSFSDNNSSTPTEFTSHPIAEVSGFGSGTISVESRSEIDIPLNGSGQFYAYGTAISNLSPLSVYVTIKGYYMGD